MPDSRVLNAFAGKGKATQTITFEINNAGKVDVDPGPLNVCLPQDEDFAEIVFKSHDNNTSAITITPLDAKASAAFIPAWRDPIELPTGGDQEAKVVNPNIGLRTRGEHARCDFNIIEKDSPHRYVVSYRTDPPHDDHDHTSVHIEC